MPSAPKTAKRRHGGEYFVRNLEEGVIVDPNLSGLDLKIVLLAMCRASGNHTANSLKRFTAGKLARTFNVDPKTAYASLDRLERLGIVVSHYQGIGKAKSYDLRFDDYLSKRSRGAAADPHKKRGSATSINGDPFDEAESNAELQPDKVTPDSDDIEWRDAFESLLAIDSGDSPEQQTATTPNSGVVDQQMIDEILAEIARDQAEAWEGF